MFKNNSAYRIAGMAFLLMMVFINVQADEYDQQAAGVLSKANEFYVVTAHIDGNASEKGDENHPPEAIPGIALPKGGGLTIKKGDQGKWRMRVFKFIPSQIIAPVGEEIITHFVGSQGPSHRIKVDGLDEEIRLNRGEIKTISLHPAKTGTINFRSLDRQPSMSGRILVMP